MLNGSAFSAVTGIVHVTSVDEDMSQFAMSTEKLKPSLCLNKTVYPVIRDPPSSGATQVTITSSGAQVVTGAAGCAGVCAARIVTMFENSL
jgi:S-adenosylmethionine synthetase